MTSETTQRDPGVPSDDRRIEAARVGSFFLVGGGAASAVVALVVHISPLPGWRPLALFGFSAGAIVGGLLLLSLASRATWAAIFAVALVSIVYVGVAMGFATGRGSFAPVFFFWAVLWTFSFFPLRWAVTSAVAAVVALAIAFALQPGWPDPFVYWIFLCSTIGVTAWTVRGLVTRAETARVELATLNQTLEAKVEQQVSELQRLGRLRRFLSTPVADAVLSSENEGLLQPHRREIAVLFCDLRGFTAFAAAAQPEDVHQVLGEYFGVLGDIVRRFEATVGAFTGDGLMAFFNDPLPVAEPALRAVSMAVECQAAMQSPIDRWRERGHDLGFGVGVTFGYANLGMIGFEGRVDYSALGRVVNLSARLCGEAQSGEVLIDQRAYAECKDRIDVGTGQDFALKGFHDPVRAYRVDGIRTAVGGELRDA